MWRATASTAALGAALALAACAGGEDGDSQTNREAEARDAMLDYARCMRANGVDMPDPKPGERGLVMRAEPGSDAATRQAEEKCRKHLEKMRPPDISEEDRAEFRERALKFARCMRARGIDMPDPQFDGGKVTQRLQVGDGPAPEDPAFQKAQEACAKYQPRREGP